MTAMTHAADSTGFLMLLMVMAMAGPVGLVVALAERGWAPVRSVRRRWQRRRQGNAFLP